MTPCDSGGERGSLLLHALLVISLLAVGVTAVMPVLGSLWRAEMTEENETRLDRIEEGILAYFRDTETVPASLQSLVVKPAGLAGWMGPYISMTVTDAASANMSFSSNSWRTAFAIVVVNGWTVQIRGFGENRINESGGGDDDVRTISLHPPAWDITRSEVDDVNSAIIAYNNDPNNLPLSTTYLTMLDELHAAGYVPYQNAYKNKLKYDAWGQAYLTVGDPVTAIDTQGPPGL